MDKPIWKINLVSRVKAVGRDLKIRYYDMSIGELRAEMDRLHSDAPWGLAFRTAHRVYNSRVR